MPPAPTSYHLWCLFQAGCGSDIIILAWHGAFSCSGYHQLSAPSTSEWISPVLAMLLLLLVTLLVSPSLSLTTCPGFPGYCSESFPGNECNVVCDVGRNNVPLCQVRIVNNTLRGPIMVSLILLANNFNLHNLNELRA